MSEEESWNEGREWKEWKGMSASLEPKRAKHAPAKGKMTVGSEANSTRPLFTQAGELRIRPVLEALSVNNQPGKMLSIIQEIKVAARIPLARRLQENCGNVNE
jgi:hypothetical protein